MNVFLEQATTWLPLVAWEAVWKSVVLLTGAGAVATALRKKSAAARHLVWTWAMAGCLVLPPVSFGLPSWWWSILPDGVNLLSPREKAPAVLTQDGQAGDPTYSGEDRAVSTTRATLPASAVHNDPATASLPSRIAPSPTWWPMALWMTGTLVIPVVQLVGWLSLLSLVRSADPPEAGGWGKMARELARQLGLRRVRFLRSDRVLNPMTWGWLRPVVLLPAALDGWPTERLRTVLLHELAHVQRRDWLTQTMAHLACAAYWFNPLVWLAARRMRIERERACDDVVLQDGARPSDYADLLLTLARSLRSARWAGFPTVAIARPSQLEGRLLSILDPSRSRARVSRRLAGLAVLGFAAMILPLASVRLSARAEPPQIKPPRHGDRPGDETRAG